MKYYAFKNIRNGRLVSGTDFRTYPHRQILADKYHPPRLITDKRWEESERLHRGISSKTYKLVEVEVREV